MPIVLCRVDDRLVHGQVVIGWGRPLHLERIVLVDDEVRASPWEQELYRMATPPEMPIEFLSAAEAAGRLEGLASGAERVLVLLGSIATASALAGGHPSALTKLNLGGVHAAPGRRERLRYLYLSDTEIAQLAELERLGIEITAQDVPVARPIALRELE